MLVIGLTGPSGAGKSSVAELFAAHGLPVINADAVYHALLIPPSLCLDELVHHFGLEILLPNGLLDRRALGRIVFSDAEALAALNAIAHHHVMAEIRRRLAELRRADVPAAVIDAPQLFEAGAERDCNVIVSVLANRELRLQRIINRDGISQEAAMKRMAAQKSDEFFRSHSDYIIENNESGDHLPLTVRKILLEMGVLQA